MVFKTDGFYNSMDEVPKYYTANKEVQLIYDNDTRMVYLPGARKLVDLNGDGRITAADKYAAASPLPKAHGGFINEIRWKNLDLNIFFNYSIGRHALKIYDDFSLKPDASSVPLFADVTKLNAWSSAASTQAAYPETPGLRVALPILRSVRLRHRKSTFPAFETIDVRLQLRREDCQENRHQ